jgi:type IV pilus assembly protein PilA
MISRFRKAQEEGEGGFTLIELLVVMIIIGILAAIAIPLFLSQRQKGFDASVKSDLHTIANEMESYYTDQQAYPTSISFLGPTSAVIGTDTVRLSPGNEFTVDFNGNDSAYCIEGASFSTAKAGDTAFPASGEQSTHHWVYVSDAGGLQPSSVTTCATSYAAGGSW